MSNIFINKKFFNGKQIIIRQLSKNDLNKAGDFQKFLNFLVKEDAKISRDSKISLKQEKLWLKKQVEEIKLEKSVVLIAEYNSKIVGIVNIGLGGDRRQHVGGLGISIRNSYRGIGIGKYLMEEIIKMVKIQLKPKPKVIQLSVFASNSPAINLYKKISFKKVAIIPKVLKYKNKLEDEIIMHYQIR